MSAPRLASVVWVNALVRRVNAAGDFATVLHKGDGIAGSVVLVHRRGAETRALQRLLAASGEYEWRQTAAGPGVDEWIERQRRYDPDLWVVELDTSNPARFIDETIAFD